MWNLLRAELLKLRRCQILLVGLVALGLCPLVQYGSQMIIEAEYRDPDYDIQTLFANVVWGNTQIFLPISLVMTGAWLMDRESSHDTLKNIMAVPVSMPGLLGTKLLLTGMLAVFLGIYSAGCYPGHWTGGRPPGTDCGGAFSWQYADRGGAFTTSLVCMPLILIFGQIRGAYLGGSILAFFLGYSMLFFKGGVLSSLYPFSAALVLAGFDLSGYAGMTAAPDLGLAAAGVGVMVLWTGLLLLRSRKKKEMRPRRQASARGKARRAAPL